MTSAEPLATKGALVAVSGQATSGGVVTLFPSTGDDLGTLLRAYATHGLGGLRAYEGMYVLAIADGDDLVLVRDPVGSRTIFYGHDGVRWIASTSLRTLRARLTPALNLAAVQTFLTFAYLPGEETLLAGVREVRPGRALRLRADGSAVEDVLWEPVEAVDESRSGARHAHHLRGLLEHATARRLPPAEPVAVLLSGGVDSSAVTALAAKLHDKPVRTYSISFGDDLPNELAYSGLVATHCNTHHRVLSVSGDVVAGRLAETVAVLDAPVGDPLTVPNLLLAEAVAGDGMSVVLNGEGGDPVYGGPKNLPMLVSEMHGGGPRSTAYLRSYRKCHDDLAALVPSLPAPDLERFVAPYLDDGPMDSLLNRLLHCNLRTKGAHHILTKVERITASRGIEGRAPLFDRAVIDHAFATPPRYKLHGTVEKWVLKEAVRDLLPATIVDRPKSGMRVPVQQWLTGPLRDLAHDALLDRTARQRGLFNPTVIRAWLRREGALLPRQGGKLWLVLTLELWLRGYGL